MKEIIEQLGVRTDFLLILVILMGVDILVGIIRAFHNREFKSSILREGLIKKLFEVIICILGYIGDYVIGINQVGLAVTILLIGAEMYSIVIENASDFVPIPKPLKDLIANLKGEESIENNKDQEQEVL